MSWGDWFNKKIIDVKYEDKLVKKKNFQFEKKLIFLFTKTYTVIIIKVAIGDTGWIKVARIFNKNSKNSIRKRQVFLILNLYISINIGIIIKNKDSDKDIPLDNWVL